MVDISYVLLHSLEIITLGINPNTLVTNKNIVRALKMQGPFTSDQNKVY